jgi:NADPH:quinone reductase
MRVIAFSDFGGPEVLRETQLAEPRAGTGQIRIRVHAAAVNPSDSLTRSGITKRLLAEQAPDLDYPPPPYVLGWDLAGVVDEIGPATDTGHRVGDPVCAVTPMGLGGYAEYAVVSARSVVRAPEGVGHEAACTLPMNGLTARVAVDRLALPAGATVAVTGAAGTLGGYVVQLARADGLHVVADSAPADEPLVRSLGADQVVRRGEDVGERIRELHPGGVDGLVDCAVQDGRVTGAVRDGGAVATVRFFSGTTERGITWHPVFVGEHVTDQDRLDGLRRQVEAGRLTLRVAEAFPARRAEQAHRQMEAGGVRGRLVLTW